MKFKAYISRMNREEKGIKIQINIYDEEEQADTRHEDIYYILCPFNQPDEYFESLIKKTIEDHERNVLDFENKKATFMNKEF